jgi:hypothetical protein
MEAVKYLMGAYFHQDWVMDGGRSSDTVALFLHERRDVLASTADQIDDLLETELPEGSLAELLVEWGCDYYAGESDADYRTWLTEVRDQIRTSLSASAAS